MSAESAGKKPECPTCGRDDFSSIRGMKQHHKIQHNESISGITTTCDTCGDEFRTTQYRLDNYDGAYCSDGCRWEGVGGYVKASQVVECVGCGDEFRIANNRVEGAENNYCSTDCRKTDMVEVSCSVCDSDMTVYPYVDERNENHYCSKDCWNTRSSKLVNCDNCGDEYRLIMSRVKEAENHFCSQECHHEWLPTPDNWHDSAEAKKLRQEVYERDDYTCQDCNQRGDTLNAHHIKRVSNHPELRDDVDNLVTLCVRCHHKRHLEAEEYQAAALLKGKYKL